MGQRFKRKLPITLLSVSTRGWYILGIEALLTPILVRDKESRKEQAGQAVKELHEKNKLDVVELEIKLLILKIELKSD